MSVVALVGCASTKLDHPAPARDLYRSGLFTKASAYAEAVGDRWFILSAKHGLVEPDEEIEPYDVRLGTRTGPPIHDWSARVMERLHEEVAGMPDVRIVLLAGRHYRTPFESPVHPCPWPVEVPMEGMGIGEQLGFLTHALRVLVDTRR